MTTVTSIIKSALRETNLIPLGVEPTQDQLDEGFSLLSTIVASVLGNEAGENLTPMPLGQGEITSPTGYPWWSNELPGNIFVPTNTRIMCNLTGPGTINLHPRPHDGARMGIVDVSQNFDEYPLTINGNGRSIEGEESMEYDTAGEIREWLYREDLGNWVVVTPLVADGDMPWPTEFDDMFIIMLAMRINPRYGQVIHPASQAALKLVMQKFSARYSQSTTQMPSEDGLLYLTNYYRFYGRFANRQYGDPADYFNSGVPVLMVRFKKPLKEWPCWFYGPDGASGIFESLEEVPTGWTRTPDEEYIAPVSDALDKDQLVEKLKSRGITVRGNWSKAYMKEILDNGSSTSGHGSL